MGKLSDFIDTNLVILVPYERAGAGATTDMRQAGPGSPSQEHRCDYERGGHGNAALTRLRSLSPAPASGRDQICFLKKDTKLKKYTHVHMLIPLRKIMPGKACPLRVT